MMFTFIYEDGLNEITDRLGKVRVIEDKGNPAKVVVSVK